MKENKKENKKDNEEEEKKNQENINNDHNFKDKHKEEENKDNNDNANIEKESENESENEEEGDQDEREGDYEMMRLKNIEANNKILAELGLLGNNLFQGKNQNSPKSDIKKKRPPRKFVETTDVERFSSFFLSLIKLFYLFHFLLRKY